MEKPARSWLHALPVLFILAVTLLPASGTSPAAIDFCIACGRRGVAEGVLNAMLFFPLGFVPVGGSRSFARRVLAGLLLSMVIELTQVFVPGRDPSLSDVVFNTIGTALGAYAARTRRHWLDPDTRESRILTVAGVAAVIGVATATVLSLAPLNYSEWATHHFAVEIGRIDSSDNIEILALIQVTRRGDTITVERSGHALGVAYRTWAGAHGLDEPVYWSHDVFEAQRLPLRLSLDIARSSWRVSLDAAKERALGPSVGLGWALLLYPDALGPRWMLLVDSVWLFALCFPIGYWSSGRYLLSACAVLAVGLVMLPLVAGAAPTSLPEWIGVASGLLVGKSVGALRVPWRSNYRA